MKYIKIILSTIWIIALAACTTVGGNGGVGESSVKKTTVRTTQTTTQETSSGETTAIASPIEAPKTYESESTATPAVQTTFATPAPKAIVPTPANINSRQGLPINMGYQQAWGQTAKALSQAGYPVMEQDNSSGTYYILDKIGTGGVIKRDTPIYQLRLQKAGDNKTLITLSNAQNQPADDSVVQRILGALKNRLGA